MTLVSTYQRMVSQFNRGAGSSPEAELRIKLIREEGKETLDAFNKRDLVEVIDGLCDLLYVTYGAADLYRLILDTQQDEAAAVRSPAMGWDTVGRTIAGFSNCLGETCDAIHHLGGVWEKGPRHHSSTLVTKNLQELASACWLIGSQGLGVDLRPFFCEVHRTNMLKFDGGYKREDGKQMKPADWKPPRIAKMLDFYQKHGRLHCVCSLDSGGSEVQQDPTGGQRCGKCDAFFFIWGPPSKELAEKIGDSDIYGTQLPPQKEIP
jgi:predicted HAD superfamily Cof-like phosphohydrolase